MVSIDADALERLSGGDEFDDESGVDLNETVEDLSAFGIRVAVQN